VARLGDAVQAVRSKNAGPFMVTIDIFCGTDAAFRWVDAVLSPAAVGRLVTGLKLAVNERKTRCLRCPEEAFEFLGYRIGRNYRPHGEGVYIGTRPSKASVRSICRRISEMTSRRWTRLPTEARVERLNRLMTGWANYFSLGQVSPAYAAVDRHATRRLRQWLCRKHKVRTGKEVRFPAERLWQKYGLTRLAPRTTSFPWAKA